MFDLSGTIRDLGKAVRCQMGSKKELRNLAAIFVVFVGTGFLAACGKTGGDAGSTGVITQGGYTYTCTDAGCTYPMPTNKSMGFYSQTSNFYTGYAVRPENRFQINAGMTTVLKDMMGVCDRQVQVGGFNGGYAGCSWWTGANSAHDFVIYSPAGSTASEVKLIIRSVPGQPSGYYWYSYSLPDFKSTLFSAFGFRGTGGTNYSAIYDPLVLDATVWPTNDDKGFEVRANGPVGSFGWNKLLQVIVLNGKLEDGFWDYKMYIAPNDGARAYANNNTIQSNGASLAISGTSVQCNHADCALGSTYFY